MSLTDSNKKKNYSNVTKIIATKCSLVDKIGQKKLL